MTTHPTKSAIQAEPALSAAETKKWYELIFTKKMLICIVLGFSSGLPLYFILNLMPAWMRTEGLNLKTISAFALIQLPYTWKFLWSPLMDRYNILPMLGRRRSWMLLTQLGLLASIMAYGLFKPSLDITAIAILSVTVTFLSASQDIVLDAYRREILSDQELGLGNSIFVNSYRLASLVPGSLSLILSDMMPWNAVFAITALFMLPAIIMTFVIAEPISTRAPKTLVDSVIEPFVEFFSRNGWVSALWVLGFILMYKLGDSMATALATPFYLDMHFTKTDIGAIAKGSGLLMQIVGAFIGGIWMLKIGINKALWLFGIVQLISILGFAWMAHSGPFAEIGATERSMLALVIGFEALGVGLGTAAFVAYIAREASHAFAATQLALLTSLSAIPRSIINAMTGTMVESLGWENFFYVCALLGIPGMLMLFKIAPWSAKNASPQV